ncbi:MAG: RDD family protein, partial [Dethiobacteria bacterium]
MSEEGKVKDCPYCGEEILEKAVKCKHCKSDLPVSSDADKISAVEPTPPATPFVPPAVQPAASEGETPPPPLPPREDMQGSGYIYPKASVGIRILAFIIDSLIGGIPVAILVPLGLIPFFTVVRSYDYYGSAYQSAPNVVMIIFMVLAIIIGGGWSLFYFLFRDGFGAGQSWGKKICGLMVVNLDDNSPCNKRKSFVRNIFAWIIT